MYAVYQMKTENTHPVMVAVFLMGFDAEEFANNRSIFHVVKLESGYKYFGYLRGIMEETVCFEGKEDN